MERCGLINDMYFWNNVGHGVLLVFKKNIKNKWNVSLRQRNVNDYNIKGQATGAGNENEIVVTLIRISGSKWN